MRHPFEIRKPLDLNCEVDVFREESEIFSHIRQITLPFLIACRRSILRDSSLILSIVASGEAAPILKVIAIIEFRVLGRRN
jgi:hypothetical protein